MYETGFNIILDMVILMFVDYLKCENYVKNKEQLISKDDLSAIINARST